MGDFFLVPGEIFWENAGNASPTPTLETEKLNRTLSCYELMTLIQEKYQAITTTSSTTLPLCPLKLPVAAPVLSPYPCVTIQHGLHCCKGWTGNGRPLSLLSSNIYHQKVMSVRVSRKPYIC